VDGGHAEPLPGCQALDHEVPPLLMIEGDHVYL
jgi:hypothetical protein